MPERLSADWDQVRIKCNVIGVMRPGFVSVSSEAEDLICDEDLMHWDSVGSMVCVLNGSEFVLRQSFVPYSLQRPNASFWLCIGNDGLFRLYDDAAASTPVAIGTRDQAQ